MAELGSHEKKLAILQSLEKQPRSIGLSDLLALLGEGFAERSVRRWMAEMVGEGLVEKVGSTRGARYRIKGSFFSEESRQILEAFARPTYERLPVAYNMTWFDDYLPNQSSYLPAKLRKELHEVGDRSRDHEPAGTYAHRIYQRLLIDLSFNSSRLEGNTYSLLETERLLLKGESAEGKLDQEKVMILNHKEAIRYLIDSAERLKVNRETVGMLHYLLSDSLLGPEETGKVRRHGVRIGDSTYIPYEDPALLESQLHAVCDKAAQIEDPFEQSLFLLIHLSYLQAFVDVNKRTARLSSNISLIKGNFAPLSFNDVSRPDYMAAMIAIYELQRVEPVVDLYVHSYLRTCAAYDATAESLGFDEIRVRYRQERRAVMREVILRNLHGQAMVSFVQSEIANVVPQKDRQAVIEDAMEELTDMNPMAIAGLGITSDQLNAWLRP